jgi:hypothetical protein
MNKFDEAEQNAQMAVTVYDKYGKKEGVEATIAAKAYFTLGRVLLKKCTAIKLDGANERAVQERLKDKTKALEPVLKAFANSMGFGISEWTLRSTYEIGISFVNFAEDFKNQKLFGSMDEKTASKIKIISGLEKYYVKGMEKFEWIIITGCEQGITNEWVDKSIAQFMKMAFKKGHLFEDIGEIFKSAPIPKGLPPDEQKTYKDVLEEKYLEAMDAALPKYEEGLKAAEKLGITGSEWTDSIKARISFINPASEVLQLTIQPRQCKPTGATPAPLGTQANAVETAGKGQNVDTTTTDADKNLKDKKGNKKK